jgi:hypothetical protein
MIWLHFGLFFSPTHLVTLLCIQKSGNSHFEFFEIIFAQAALTAELLNLVPHIYFTIKAMHVLFLFMSMNH